MRELSIRWMRYSGDFWGGLAAMLVALPAAVAFGVTVYSAISPHYAAFGALAGLLGATALGLIAPVFGGTDRLISAPCAPAAAGNSSPARRGQPAQRCALVPRCGCWRRRIPARG